MATQFQEIGRLSLRVIYISVDGFVKIFHPLSVLDERGRPVQKIPINAAFNETIVLLNQADGFSAITGVLASGVTMEYSKESDASLTTLPASGFTWTERGSGLYQANFTSGFTSETGRFTVVVSEGSVTGFVPFYGESQVVRRIEQETHNQVTGLNTILSGQSVNILSDVNTNKNLITGLPTLATDFPSVQVGASWDGVTLGLSLGLEREGQLVSSVTSGEYSLYNETGAFLASGSSVTGDAQGVFHFENTTVTPTDDSVPYLHAQITDVSGTVLTRQFLPVVG